MELSMKSGGVKMYVCGKARVQLFLLRQTEKL